MKSIELRVLGGRMVPGWRALLLTLAVSLAGCQFLAAPDQPQQAQGPGAEVGPAGEGDAVVRSPNPYLVEPPSVPSAARGRFRDALAALDQQQWEIAETDLLWLTANYPQLSGPHLNLALLYQRTGQDDKVEPAFRAAIDANTNNVGAYNQYAIYLRAQGRFNDAESVYQQALAVWPDSPQTHLNLGILYDLYMGRLDRALEHYRRYQALQDEPDRRIEGWIVDTERRLSQQSEAGDAS